MKCVVLISLSEAVPLGFIRRKKTNPMLGRVYLKLKVDF